MVKRGENYERNGDMTPPGDSVLIAHIQHDGDVCLRINNKDSSGDVWYADIEFCASGGKSINTLHALHALVAAMAKDCALRKEIAMTPAPELSDERCAQIADATIEACHDGASIYDFIRAGYRAVPPAQAIDTERWRFVRDECFITGPLGEIDTDEQCDAARALTQKVD